MTAQIKTAMVLAAGLGTRMRPLTEKMPKPLVKVAGKALIDYALDHLASGGVETAVVNVHYLADQLERHLASRVRPKVIISDERAALLGTGGAVVKALPHLGNAPFFHLNSDSIWLDGKPPNLARLASAFDPGTMDGLLLLAPTKGSVGYSGPGDFALRADGRLTPIKQAAPFVFAGVAILSPALVADPPRGEFSLTPRFERAAQAGRLHGLRLDGLWMHVGTPDAIPAAEVAVATHKA